jgi:hypothetical protein
LVVTEVTPVYLQWELAKAEGPPGVSVSLPQAGQPMAAIPTVVVQFWEHVTGVDASDVQVNGSAATGLEVVSTGTGLDPGRDYYVFTGFAPPALGDAEIEVLPGTINDDDGNAFEGFSWTVPVAADGDGDGVPDSVDDCPTVPDPTQVNTDRPMLFASQYSGHSHDEVGDALGDACDDDDDDDGFTDPEEAGFPYDPLDPNVPDGCPDDPAKLAPGLCGCGAADVDSDGDRIVDCTDECPGDSTDFTAPCSGNGCAAGKCRDLDQTCKSCGQPVSSGAQPTATDALAVLRAAIGTLQCARCVCDVDGSNSVVATDALLTLKRAVGHDVSLACGA